MTFEKHTLYIVVINFKINMKTINYSDIEGDFDFCEDERQAIMDLFHNKLGNTISKDDFLKAVDGLIPEYGSKQTFYETGYGACEEECCQSPEDKEDNQQNAEALCKLKASLKDYEAVNINYED